MNRLELTNAVTCSVRPARMMRLLGLLTALLTVAACGSPPLSVGSPPAPAPPPPAAPALDPLALVGWWRVDGSDQLVVFDPALVEVRGAEAVLTGSWTADPAGRFLALIGTRSATDGTGGPAPVARPGGGAPVPTPGDPRWLVDATGYAVDGDDRVLTAPDGTATRLVAVPPPGPAEQASGVDPTRPPTDLERRAVQPAGPVPAGLVPAADVTGRWVPEGGPSGPFAEFAEDGTWTGSDGCNGTGGRYLAGPDGGFLAVVSPVSTLIACDGVDVGTQVGQARRAVLDGEVLVLLDAAGTPVGRFVRA